MNIHRLRRRRRKKKAKEATKTTATTSANVIVMDGVNYEHMETVNTLEEARAATISIREKGFRASYRKRKEGYKIFQGPTLKKR